MIELTKSLAEFIIELRESGAWKELVVAAEAVIGREDGMVCADTIEQGQCFRKKNGTYAYIRISESAVSHYPLDRGCVYGVCYNGNMTKITRLELVEPVNFAVFERNRELG